MDETLRAIGMGLVVVSAALADACVIAHQMLARWWETPEGRHVMAYQAVLAAVLTLWAVAIILPGWQWFHALRLAAFALVPPVLAWRLAIIVQAWQRGRSGHRKDTT